MLKRGERERKKNRNLIKSIDDRPCERRSAIIEVENHSSSKYYFIEFEMKEKENDGKRENRSIFHSLRNFNRLTDKIIINDILINVNIDLNQ